MVFCNPSILLVVPLGDHCILPMFLWSALTAFLFYNTLLLYLSKEKHRDLKKE